MLTTRLFTPILLAAAAGCVGGPEQEALYSDTRSARVMITPLYWDEPGTAVPAGAQLTSAYEQALNERMNEIGWNQPIQYIFRSLQRQAWQELDQSITDVQGMRPVVGQGTVHTVPINYLEETHGEGRPGEAMNFEVTTGSGDLARSSRFAINFVDIAEVYGHPVRIAGLYQPSRTGFDFDLLYTTRGYASSQCDVMRLSYDDFSDTWTGHGQELEELTVALQPTDPAQRPVSPLAALLDAMALESYWVDNAGWRIDDLWSNRDANIEDDSGTVPNHVKLTLRCWNDLVPSAAHLIMRVDFIIE